MAKTRLDFNGVSSKVFDIEIIKGFLTIKQLRYFAKATSFQRAIDKNHVEKIKKFITDKDKIYKIFPEVVITLPTTQNFKDAEVNIKRKIIKSYGGKFTQIEFKNLETIQKYGYCEIVDGNHRIQALLETNLADNEAMSENNIIPVSFVNISEEIEAKAFFYYLNAKSKRLLSTDYFNYLEEEENVDQFKKIDDELYYFKIIFDELKDLSDDEDFAKHILEFSNYLVKVFDGENLSFMIEKDSNNLKSIVEFFKSNFQKLSYIELESKINMLKLSGFLLGEQLKNEPNRYKETATIETTDRPAEEIAEDVATNKETENNNKSNLDKDLLAIGQTFEEFQEWLDTSGLEASELNNLHAIEVLYRIFKNTYKPKGRKIFLSMPFDRETELTYFAVKDTIRKLNHDHDLGIEEIRIDKHTYPTSEYIPQLVYKEIEDCGLMIADLTGNNRNVYNEIGYKTALDNDLERPRIILIHNTASYYDENAKKYGEVSEKDGYERGKAFNCESDDGICEHKIKVKELKHNDVGFNISAIHQIRFKDTEYLQDRLYDKLYEYFTNYKIKLGK